MRILLEECVPEPLCVEFVVEHECQTARRVGFGGKANGELLRLAEEAGFEVLLTIDKGFAYQQNIRRRKITVVIVKADSNRLSDLLPHIPACLEALRSIHPGETLVVGSETHSS